MTAVARRIADNIRRAVQVRDEVLEQVIVAMLAEGHILVEDYPGVGKTALARALGAVGRLASSRASSAPPTCCPPTSSAPTSTTSASSDSSSAPARSSPTS